MNHIVQQYNFKIECMYCVCMFVRSSDHCRRAKRHNNASRQAGNGWRKIIHDVQLNDVYIFAN